jgi:hypothetical protein
MEALTSYEWPVRVTRSGSKYDVLLNDNIYRLTRGDELFPADVPVRKLNDRIKQVAYKRNRKALVAIENEDSIVVQFAAKPSA